MTRAWSVAVIEIEVPKGDGYIYSNDISYVSNPCPEMCNTRARGRDRGGDKTALIVMGGEERGRWHTINEMGRTNRLPIVIRVEF